ncbi:MAG: hypothetical protein JXA91_00505, partial [Candidatus Thermoplasmatota archaeon]|nr:hypothetical protein [Candidatus Thermoplasmatota archaeon]
EYTFKYVIITTEEMREDFQSLADYKNSRGTSTTVVTVEDILDCEDYDWDGEWGDKDPYYNDDQCHIRNFIKSARNNWGTDYILLGGDHPDVPARYLCGSWIHDYYQYNIQCPSDLYYACLDRNFDADKDGIWGWFFDYPDFSPEVYVGRAPVDTIEDVQNFINKTKFYSESDSQELYLGKVLMLGMKTGFDEPDGYTNWGGNFCDDYTGNDYYHGPNQNTKKLANTLTGKIIPK